MALYKGDVMLAGIGNGFNPASTGTTGQILTKTASGYDWDNAPDSSNVKAFPLSGSGSSASVLAEAQAAYDWYAAGKTPIIIYNSITYILSSAYGNFMYFTGVVVSNHDYSSTSDSQQAFISFTLSSGQVTNVSNNNWSNLNYLRTDVNYSSPYIPLYNGSPATKKYVDDNAGMKLAPNSPLSPKYHWFGTEAQYQALSQYYTDEENDTVYYTI